MLLVPDPSRQISYCRNGNTLTIVQLCSQYKCFFLNFIQSQGFALVIAAGSEHGCCSG